jgi:hypothetical protein
VQSAAKAALEASPHKAAAATMIDLGIMADWGIRSDGRMDKILLRVDGAEMAGEGLFKGSTLFKCPQFGKCKFV